MEGSVPVKKLHQISMAPLLGKRLKPLSDFKRKKPPTQPSGPEIRKSMNCNQSAHAVQWGNLARLRVTQHFDGSLGST